MLYRFFPLTTLLFSAIFAFGQTPVNISIQRGGQTGGLEKSLACADQFAGTISFSNFLGQSNDTGPDTIYMCYQDQFNVVHNGNANLTGDPNSATTPGIKYGFFNCRPTVSGPNLTAVLTNPCIINNPPPTEGLYVTAGGSFSGNLTFSNTGQLQNFFNGGDPMMIWFAPITIDFFNNNTYENHPVTMEKGPCVNLNVDEAFAVVYLNEVRATNLVENAGLSGCLGTFDVRGGLPQFDGSFYDISIQLVGNPNVRGQVVEGPYGHNQTVMFRVPVPGVYNITIEDGKSCGAALFANMSSCVTVSQSVQSASVAPGDNICLNVTNEGGFVDLVAMQYALTWDTTVLRFTNLANLTPLLPGFTQGGSFNTLGDSLIFSWASLAGAGIDLPDGAVMYQACFDVVGGDGDCTDVRYVDPAGPGIEVVNENGTSFGFNGVAGNICVSASALVANFTQDSVSCSGGSDGSFTLSVSGGQTPYSITWRNSAGGPVQGPATINTNGGSVTIQNLSAGNYLVTITDSGAIPLFTTEQISVFSPPILSILLIENPPPCNGLTGSITADLVLDSVLVGNPTSRYNFLWSNNATTRSITNILSGAYSLTVTERSTGCTLANGTFLPQPPPYNISITVDSSTCSGIGDGALHVAVGGGTPDNNNNYVIHWPTIGPPPGLIINNTLSNIAGLPSDSYPLQITDANNCLFERDVWLPAKKVLSINAVITDVNCMNACSGAIFASGTTTGRPPSLPYNFAWFGTPPPPPPTFTLPTSSTISSLCVGTYTVVMEDAAGCEIDTTFNIVELPPLTLNVVNLENESCQPGGDGNITVAATGGSYPYTYSWNVPATDSTATDLSQGTYTVSVTDANGCMDSLSTDITAPIPPVLQTFEDDTVSCTNSVDGSLQVTAIPGDSPIVNYVWSNGVTGSNNSSIVGLGPGQYAVTIYDANGCVLIDTATVTAPLPLSLDSIATMPPQCPGLGGGSVTMFISGGTNPYFFNWSNGVAGTGFNVNGSIRAGNYSATITDANGCPPLIANAILNDPPSIMVNFTAIDSVSCANTGQSCDGQATANAIYSDGSGGSFDFTWQSGESTAGATASTALRLCKANQQVIVSDGTCFDTFTVSIPAPLPIVPGQIIRNVSCNGLADGQITLTPSGGTPPFSITWPNGQSGPTLSGLTAGNYMANIMDAKMCSFTHTVSIIEPDPLDAFLDMSATMNISCAGDANGIITVQVQGGNLNLGNPVFLWANGAAGPASNSATNLPPGAYSVTVVDTKGCRDSVTHNISEPPPIQFSLGSITPISCFGTNTFVTVDSVWGGNPTTYQYSVDNGINRLPGSPSPVFAGQHLITVVDVINGCTADTSILISEPLELSIDLPGIVEIELGDSLTRLNPTLVFSVPIDSFVWTPPDQLSCTDCKSPRVNAILSQLYTLKVIDENGCSASAQILVDVDKNRNVYIPNVFSPNNDGVNDDFRIYTGKGVTRIHFFRIYDRWGELMFEANDLTPDPDGTIGWDGRFNGQKMNPAVFMYLAEIEFLDKQVLLYRGDVTLMR